MKEDLIRFVTDARHPPYGNRTGIFPSTYTARRNHWLDTDGHEELCELLTWFADNLTVPDRFEASRRHNGDKTGISWIRASADEHMKRLRRLSELLQDNGVPVHELRTTRPGYVLYEDDHQVVALPFSDTPR